MQLPCINGSMVPYTKTSLLYIGGQCRTREGELRTSEVIYQFHVNGEHDMWWSQFKKLEQVSYKAKIVQYLKISHVLKM